MPPLRGSPMRHISRDAWFMGRIVSGLTSGIDAPDESVLDLKADGRGYTHVEETIPRLPDKPEPVLCAKILHQVAGLGRIHASQPCSAFRHWRSYCHNTTGF